MSRRVTPRTPDYSLLIMILVLLLGGQGLWAASQCCESSMRFGVFAAMMSLLSTLVVSAYWWRTYRQHGLQARPRISFRETYVLYFGMSIEVGLIVNCITMPGDIALAFSSILLPPALIAIIALMDDTPDACLARARLVAPKAVLPQNSAKPPESGPGSNSGDRKRRRKLAHVRARSKAKLEGAERRVLAAAPKRTPTAAPEAPRGWPPMLALFAKPRLAAGWPR
jgi:hypothetical protein